MQQPLYLQIQAEGDKYTFNYSTDGHSFKNLGGIVSGDRHCPEFCVNGNRIQL